MKRAVILAVSLSLMFSLAACGTNGNDRQLAVSPAPSSPVETQSGEQADLSDTPVSAQEERGESAADDRPAQSLTEAETEEKTPPVMESENVSSQQPQSSDPFPEEPHATQQPESENNPKENAAMKMNVQIGNNAFTATMEENAAVDALMELMETAPVVIEMSDYAGFEKVGSLGTGLPTANSQTTTQSGDIVLYNGNQIVIFYGSNSWSYTRLGRIDDLTGWEQALGSGDVTVSFSIS